MARSSVKANRIPTAPVTGTSRFTSPTPKVAGFNKGGSVKRSFKSKPAGGMPKRGK